MKSNTKTQSINKIPIISKQPSELNIDQKNNKRINSVSSFNKRNLTHGDAHANTSILPKIVPDNNRTNFKTTQPEVIESPQQGNESSSKSKKKVVETSTSFNTKKLNNSNIGDGNDGPDPIIEPPTKDTIQVCIRIKPISMKNPKEANPKKCLKYIDSKSLQYLRESQNTTFNFTYVLDESTSQEEAFQKSGISLLVKNAFDGYPTTIFAYGQTGSGKSYTMFGREDVIGKDLMKQDKLSGLVSKATKILFSLIKGQTFEFNVKVSFTEIYNEKLNDLLNPKNQPNLKLRWTNEQGYFIENVTIVNCLQPEDITDIIVEGLSNRKTGSHYLNSDSSRSHSILSLNLICKDKAKLSTLTFVDLAGSERLKDTKAEGVMIKEAGNINKSLLCLGKVISLLSDKSSSKKHIPFRDSKLTLLLAKAFGGNSKTLIIGCVSPAQVYCEDTLNTLIFASKAMNIQSKPYNSDVKNQKDESKTELMRQNKLLKEENLYLREQYKQATGLEFEMSGSPQEIKGAILPISGNTKTKPINAKDTAKKAWDDTIAKLKQDNHGLKQWKLMSERQNNNLESENSILISKLDSLEDAFVGSNIVRNRDGSVFNNIGGDYNLSSLYIENTQLISQIERVELENLEMKEVLAKNNRRKKAESSELQENELREFNMKLTRKIEFLQKRERELLEKVMLLKSSS